MNTLQKISMAAATACMLAAGAVRADEPAVTEARPIDARVTRVAIDGPVALTIRRGATAALTITAEKRYLPKITTAQNGDSLRIGADFHGMTVNFGKKTPIRAELTLPGLIELTSAGVGPSDISGFTGDEIRLSLEGVGPVSFNGQYKRIQAKLAGVGDMTLNAGNSDSVTINHAGLGSVTVVGNARDMKASLSGMGSLEAQKMVADNVTLQLNGLGSASIYAKNSANLTLNGLGSVTAYGKPANRNVAVDGLGKVSWR